MRLRFFTMAILAIALSASANAQQQVRIDIENLQPADGFYQTPVWVGFHNGTFDFFDSGTAASASLEALAEGGDVSGLDTDFTTAGVGQSGVITSPGGFAGAPVFDPGEVASAIFDLNAVERYFSYASMIIPSNDAFVGNDLATGIEILDGLGVFQGNQVIELGFAQVWDSGTEVNDGLGAAFSATGGTSSDENGTVALLGLTGLNYFDGTGTADGTTINFTNASASPLLRISITAVPEPSALAIIGLFAISGCCIRRRV